MLSNEILRELHSVARLRQLSTSRLAAVVEVESDGVALVSISGRPEPVIRFEGHYFDRLVSPEQRALARQAGVASPQVGAVKNPKSQPQRWQLLQKAMKIDRSAALQSVSWGIGQVMGSHWKWLGFNSIDDLVIECRSGVHGQIRLMVLYIERAGLRSSLEAGDWHRFARGYNGPHYRVNRYHEKLAQSHRRYASLLGETQLRAAASQKTTHPTSDVKTLQKRLVRLGYITDVDGFDGPQTRATLRLFQLANNLTADGIVGPETEAALVRQERLRKGRRAGQILRAFVHLVTGIGRP